MIVEGDDPIYMLTGIIPATRKLLDRAGLSIRDIDFFEVNEAFASVVLAWAKLDVDLDRVNVHGGAIAIGHPLGASGTRLLGSLINTMEDRGARRGVQLMCEGAAWPTPLSLRICGYSEPNLLTSRLRREVRSAGA